MFVRAFCTWLAEHAPYLRLAVVERLGLSSVVVTFKMKERVRLMVTGYPPDGLPGEVTLTVDEQDFPFVDVLLHGEHCSDPYEICTLDYSLAGRRVQVDGGHHAGSSGTLVVAATVGARQENRVRLDTGELVTLPGELLAFVGRAPAE